MQIIKRKTKTEIQQFDPVKNKLQVSYNSDGHLVIRISERNEEEKKSDEDTLIVFTAAQTRQIVSFIKRGFVYY